MRFKTCEEMIPRFPQSWTRPYPEQLLWWSWRSREHRAVTVTIFTTAVRIHQQLSVLAWWWWWGENSYITISSNAQKLMFASNYFLNISYLGVQSGTVSFKKESREGSEVKNRRTQRRIESGEDQIKKDHIEICGGNRRARGKPTQTQGEHANSTQKCQLGQQKQITLHFTSVKYWTRCSRKGMGKLCLLKWTLSNVKVHCIICVAEKTHHHLQQFSEIDVCLKLLLEHFIPRSAKCKARVCAKQVSFKMEPREGSGEDQRNQRRIGSGEDQIKEDHIKICGGNRRAQGKPTQTRGEHANSTQKCRLGQGSCAQRASHISNSLTELLITTLICRNKSKHPQDLN
ncbi:uncharacterized protein isoform X3 [Danio rerio]